jgi:glycogen debranching enzyme
MLNYSEGTMRKGSEKIDEKARRVKKQFEKLFWNEEMGFLYDVLNKAEKDPTLRPNQLFALGICFPLIEGVKAKKILEVVKEKLFTPAGLRSLSPDHPDYKGVYGGNQAQRDGAYHQGTVWFWLLGIYIDAMMRLGGKYAREEAMQVIENFKYHLEEVCIGSISEIFDGDSPHTPRGCIAQAGRGRNSARYD